MNRFPESHHIPASPHGPGYRLIAYPPQSPLRFLEFALVSLEAGGTPLVWESRDREAVLYLIGGVCEFTVSGAAGALAGVLDTRPAVFDGPPAAVYLPPGARLGLISPRTGARLAIFSAPPSGDRRLRQIGAHEVSIRNVGKDAWSCRVISVVDQRVASRLLVGETVGPPGHWSGYPPHKHDAAVPGREAPMEEIHHYFVRPPGGFALQMVYSKPGDPQSFTNIHRVRDGDTVVIPRGYHPVVAAGGYALAHIWAVSGEHVEYGAWSDEPTHAWLSR